MNERTVAAFHESGHAVIALAMGFKVVRVAVDYSGGGECAANFERETISMMQTAAKLCFLLGGPAAAARVEGMDVDENDPRNAVDFAQIRKLVAEYHAEHEDFTPADPLKSGFYSLGKKRASEILARCWPAVCELARELVRAGNVSGDAAALIYANAPELTFRSTP